MNSKKTVQWILGGLALMVLPLVLQYFGNAWVRIADLALLCVLLALGLNVVVGYAGLLDLGYVAFYAVGAYMFALMASPHLADTFEGFAAMFPDGLHTSIWLVIPLAALLAGITGILLGIPVRSEEHTSELQSHSDLVCRLLLEKKKNIDIHTFADPYRKVHVDETKKLIECTTLVVCAAHATPIVVNALETQLLEQRRQAAHLHA